MSKINKIDILLIFLSILFTLYLCETYLTFKHNQKTLAHKIKVYKKKTGLEYDLRSILEIYKDEKKKMIKLL